MFEHTLSELSGLLHRRECSSIELAQVYLDRIRNLDPKINCFITVTETQALRQAADADQALANGQATALTGIPIAHKDIFCTEGVRTTCGSRMLDNFIAPYDATAVSRLHAAGMVMLGKTNMDEFAMGSSTETSFYGPCRNPWNLDTVPGGSSGGSAAAIAARLTPAATGTDTGGSIRQPASLCGVTGLKPTYGMVSRYGMVAFASSLDQGGPIAQTAEDVALLLTAMAGFDQRDSTSVDRPVPNFVDDLSRDLRGLRIGLPREYFSTELNDAIGGRVLNAARELERAGARLRDISLPYTQLSIPVYYVIAPAEASSNLSRYDGIRFGYRCQDAKDIHELFCRSRSEGFGAEVKRRIMTGTYVLSAGYYDAYYLQAQKVRSLIRDDFRNAFMDVDMILAPTSPSTAFRLQERTDDLIGMYRSDIYTVAVNLAGLPALALPVGMVDDLPIGMQLIGDFFSEARLLNAGHRYQTLTDWHKRVPPGISQS